MKNSKRNLIIICVSCIVVIFVICYFLINNSKKQPIENYTCPDDYALEGKICVKYYQAYPESGTGALTICLLGGEFIGNETCRITINPNEVENPSSNPSLNSSSSSSSSSSSELNSSSSTLTSSSSDSMSANPETGNIAIFVVWVIGIVSIVYSVWYFKKTNEIQ